MRQWLSNHPAWGLALAAVLVIGGSTSGLVPVDRAGRFLVAPIGNGLTSLGRGVGSWFSELGQIGKLRQANGQLEAANQELSAALINQTQIEAENQRLRSQLGFNSRHHLRTIGADIINYQPDSSRSFIRVNRGSSDGIKTDQAVTSGGELVGIVTSVSSGRSEVMLLNDGDFRALAKTVGGQAPGIIKGRPPEDLLFERIPRDAQVKSGDVVLTSGLDGSFPAGIKIGTVQNVQAAQEGIFQTAQVKPAIDILRLTSVDIIIS